jgi:hypothetical protein
MSNLVQIRVTRLCLLTALAVLFSALTITALAAPWHSLHGGSTAPQPASLLVQESDESKVILKATFPGFRLAERHHPLAGDYVAPEIPGCGLSQTVGAPELPVLRRFIVAPPNTTVRLALVGSPQNFSLGSGQTQFFFPRQAPRIKGPRSPKLIPFDFDLAAYAANRFSPETPCRLTEAGFLAGQRLVLVEVFPLAVNPITQSLRVYPDLTITVSFDPSSASYKSAPPQPLNARQHALLSAVTVNTVAPQMTSLLAKNSLPRLLIVAPDAWLSALAPLVTHRQSRGWIVDLFGTSITGVTTTAIRAFVKARYDNPANRPDALLLIGDTAFIPCFTGVQTDHPNTDLYYACMDGGSDWQPEFPVGRLSVQTIQSLGEVVDKIITYETVPSQPWMSRAAFMASEDNHAITEDTHNAVIADWFDPHGYQSDKFYCYSHSASSSQVKTAFNAGRILGVYSGHGDISYWADGPVIYKSDILSLTNQDRYPVIFSFACLTGQFSQNECFAETWQRAPNKGAAGILASSVTSYWDEDDIFERVLFESIFKEGLRRYGEAIMRAKYRLIENYGLTATVTRYFEQYNYLGDPTTPLRQPALAVISQSPLPSGRVGQSYSETLRGTGGTEPYVWTLDSPVPAGLDLDPSSGILAGLPLAPVTNLLFTVRLTDADLAVCTNTFRIDVAVEPLRIVDGTNAGPFQAGVPFASPLSAAGGIGPYHWRSHHGGQYESRERSGLWVAARQGTGWKSDERSWKLALPWPFRFYGKTYTSLWVNSNGYLDFGSKASQWNNSEQELLQHPRIAPLWDDLRTTNVYVAISASRAVIRWTGYTFSTGNPVNFEATLKRNGKILFAYQSMKGKLSPTIGVSAGDGTNMTLTAFTGAPSLAGGTGAKLVWNLPHPKGVELNQDGLLTGMVATPLVRTLSVVVEDSSTPVQSVTALLTIRIE